MDILLAAAIPVVQLTGLLVVGLIFHVDRKPKGGE